MVYRLTLVLSLTLLGAGCDQLQPPQGSASSDQFLGGKTVTVVCPWAAGGGTDRLSRFWADALQQALGTPFVVVNKTGGSGSVGHSAGALARPDGQTLTMITAELSTMHLMGISPVTYRDFAPVLQMNADAAAIIVRTEAPWQSLNEMLEQVRQSPGDLKMSGTATGGTWDLARAGLLHAAGLPVNAIVWIPTQGASPSLIELLGGHIDAVCCSVPEAATQLESGQLRALAVLAEERLADFPEVPTAKEQGVDWVAVGWRGLALPQGTPRETVDRFGQQCREIAQSEQFAEFMRKNGYAIEVRDADAFTQFLAAQEEQWRPVVEAAGYAQ